MEHNFGQVFIWMFRRSDTAENRVLEWDEVEEVWHFNFMCPLYGWFCLLRSVYISTNGRDVREKQQNNDNEENNSSVSSFKFGSYISMCIFSGWCDRGYIPSPRSVSLYSENIYHSYSLVSFYFT